MNIITDKTLELILQTYFIQIKQKIDDRAINAFLNKENFCGENTTVMVSKSEIVFYLKGQWIVSYDIQAGCIKLNCDVQVNF